MKTVEAVYFCFGAEPGNSRARRGSKPQAAQAIDEDEEDALFEVGEFGESNPAALWWVLSLHFGFRARENISLAIRYCLPPLQF